MTPNTFKKPKKINKIWSNGKIIPFKKNIDSLNYSLHYASPVIWEGLRSYKQKDTSTKIFKLEAHIDRLFDSAKIIGIKIPFTKSQIIEGCKALVDVYGGGDLYIRPIVYSSGNAEDAKPQDPKIEVDIFAFPLKPLHKDRGIKCIISSYKRGYPQFQMQAKTSTNYSFLQLVKPDIEKSKVDEALLIDNNGYIVEATVANIFVIKGDLIMTPPNDGSILPGITRATIARLLQNLAISKKYDIQPTVMEKKITKADLYTADEVLLTGTYVEVGYINEIDGRSISEGTPGKYFKILKEEYKSLVKGFNNEKAQDRRKSRGSKAK